MAFAACRKDGNDLVVEIEEASPEILVRNTLRGQVLDENGTPVLRADIAVRDNYTQTDNEGRFIIKNATVSSSGGLVTVEKDGYFLGSNYVNFAADGSSFSQITLMEKGQVQTIDSRQNSEISINGNAKIRTDAGTIVNASGDIYEGEVDISARWLDPSDKSVAAIMPGELTGVDSDGNQFALATYGMVVFEMQTPDGEELKVADGETVELEMPIPAELLDDAPEDIPLWFFDLEEEQWLLKGSCKKTGGSYICKVTSGGYWNCDIGLEAICLSGKIFNADTTFASFVRVEIEDLTDNFFYWGWTDSMGVFCGSVPQAALLRLTIRDHCDNVLYTEDIGPFAEDFDLDPIFLSDIVNEYFFTISGSMSHCMTNDVPQGHIGVRIPGKLSVFPLTGGGLSQAFGLKCTDFPEIEITGYSLDQMSATLPIIHMDSSDIDLGNDFRTCETVVDFFNLTVDTVDYFATPTQWFFKNNTTTDWLVMEAITPFGEMKIELRDYTGLGVYQANAFFDSKNEILLNPNFPELTAASPNISIEITDDDGNLIMGTITGTAQDPIGTDFSIDGDFVVRRAP